MDEQHVYPHSGIVFSLEKGGDPTPATAWMSLENVVPSDISQIQRDKY